MCIRDEGGGGGEDEDGARVATGVERERPGKTERSAGVDAGVQRRSAEFDRERGDRDPPRRIEIRGGQIQLGLRRDGISGVLGSMDESWWEAGDRGRHARARADPVSYTHLRA